MPLIVLVHWLQNYWDPNGYKLFIEILKILPSILIAYFAFVQKNINKTSLRLGLYNRRFNTYSCFLEFYQVLMAQEFKDIAEYKKIHRKFIAAKLESKLLFKQEDNIYQILDQVDNDSYHIVQYEESLNYGNKSELFKEHQERMHRLELSLKKVEQNITKYLECRKIL